ncbi:MAG: hypothetical protein V4633_20695 [Pseudomonadota bacterium]
MRLPRRFDRAREVLRVRSQLERDGFPRIQMFMLVSLTGLSGLGASFLMLQAGVAGMALRYTLAMGIAYIVFLLLLWCWLRVRADDFVDAADLVEVVPDFSSASSFGGGGGSFDGGGASANFDTDISDSPVSDALGAAGSADEAAIPIAIVLFVAAIVLSSLYVIYSAPVLFAEMLVDSILSASLYRRLRGLDANHWIESALKRTIWPFVLTTLVVAAAGGVMGHYVPQAHTVGEVLRAWMAS